MSTAGRPLVVCAQPEEVRALLASRPSTTRRVAEGVSSWRIRVEGLDLDLAVTGEGRQRARRGMEALLRTEPSSVLVVGVAGALTVDLEVGDLILAAALREEGGPVLVLPAPALEWGALRGRAAEIVTVDEIVTGVRRRRELVAASTPGTPVAVDMESYDYARPAVERGLAVTVARVVSDRADEALPAFLGRHRRRDGSIDRFRIGLAAALRPASWGRLLTLRGRVRAASETLAEVVGAFARRLG